MLNLQYYILQNVFKYVDYVLFGKIKDFKWSFKVVGGHRHCALIVTR